MNIMRKAKMLVTTFAIAYIAYNSTLFALLGFTGHGVEFWISYGFVTVAFLLPSIGIGILGTRGLSLRDWFFGYPLVRHSAVYLSIEVLVSTVFIVLNCFFEIKWGLVFAPQFLILCAYLMFAISCLLSKRIIDDVHTNIKDKTTFIRLLKVDADVLVNYSKSNESKTLFSNFAEEVRYSDPMSNEALFELEKEISLAVAEAIKKCEQNDEASALELCRNASRLLSERNKKTEVLK